MDIIDICGGDALCMEPATRLVTIHIEVNGKADARELKTCPRHLMVLREHARRRCALDRTLTISFNVKELR